MEGGEGEYRTVFFIMRYYGLPNRESQNKKLGAIVELLVYWRIQIQCMLSESIFNK